MPHEKIISVPGVSTVKPWDVCTGEAGDLKNWRMLNASGIQGKPETWKTQYQYCPPAEIPIPDEVVRKIYGT